MAVPRNRHSNARKNTKRAHHAKVAKCFSVCKECGEKRISHAACPACGKYNGRLIKSTPAQ
jgi:large subunit ribosomal protein L32